MATIRKMWVCKNTQCKNPETGKHRGYKKVSLGEKSAPPCKWCQEPMKLNEGNTIRLQVDGQQKTKVTSANKKLAEAVLGQYKEAARVGDLLPGEEPAITWKEAEKAFTNWIEDSVKSQDISKWTAKTYKTGLLSLRSAFGKMRLHEIDIESVRAYKKAEGQRVKKGTVKTYLGVLTRMLSFICEGKPAKKYRKLHDVFTDIKKVRPDKVDNGRDNILETEEEMKVLLSNCKTPHLRHFVLGVLNTGLRHQDMLALRLSEISFPKNQIVTRVKGHASKGRTEVVIPLTPQYRTYLEEWIKSMKVRPIGGDGYLIPKPNGKGRYTSFTTVFTNACEKSAQHYDKLGKHDVAERFRKLVPHDLRHTFATHYLYKSGGSAKSIHVLGQILGHSDAYITQRYAHDLQEVQQEEMTNFGNAMWTTL